MAVAKKKSVLFLISDFLDSGYDKPLGVAAKKHDFIALKLADNLENKIPPSGLLRLYDLETGSERMIDTSSKRFRKEYAKRTASRGLEFENSMNRFGVDRVYIPAGGDYASPLIKFFEKRAKRIRR